MIKSLYIKHDQRIRRALGCDRATLIFDRLEFYFSRHPNGFYKFIEPNSHKLYKPDDSWTELLDCHRTSFWRAFKLIGKKHTSKWEFDKAKDKFEDKLYACYYDRLTNRMFFVKNHSAVKEFFAKLRMKATSESNTNTQVDKNNPNSLSELETCTNTSAVRTEQNARSNKDSKQTSPELFKNNSHADNDIVKKMIEIWTAIVEEGRGQIELTSKRIAFLKKAFKDKFDSCLEIWKKYCIEIARNKFLMGEKTPWKASLDWALEFKSIQKVSDGYYGVGDRELKYSIASIDELQEEILEVEESDDIKKIRSICLNTVGNAIYLSWFKHLEMQIREGGTLALMATHGFSADYLKNNFSYQLEQILKKLDTSIINLCIFVTGEQSDRIKIERNRQLKADEVDESEVELESNCEKEHPNSNDLLEVEQNEDFMDVDVSDYISPETKAFRRKLREIIPPSHFPSWLLNIEVETITSQGKLILTFEDRVTADWCKRQLSRELVEAAAQLWPQVVRIDIQEKSISSTRSNEEYEGTDDSSFMNLAIQSLLNSSIVRGQGTHMLNDNLPY